MCEIMQSLGGKGLSWAEFILLWTTGVSVVPLEKKKNGISRTREKNRNDKPHISDFIMK